MNISMLNKKVLVEKDADADLIKSPGGIILPDSTARKVTKIGTVVAIGDGSSVKIGDVVYFYEGNATTFDAENAKYLVLREEDILGIKSQQINN